MDLSDDLTKPFLAKKKVGNIYKSPTVCHFFFDKHSDLPDKWKCKNCKEWKSCKIKVSYSNLRNHLCSCLGANYEDQITEYLAETKQIIGSDGRITRTLLTGSTGFQRYTQKQRDCLKWLKAIVMCNLALSACDNEDMKDLAGCNEMPQTCYSFCSKTMRKYILALTFLVEKEIAKTLEGKLLSAMFDGWEHRRRKYIGLFAGYEDAGFFEEVLLAIQPTMDEDENGTADAHVDLIKSTLEIYAINMEEQLVCLGADK